MTRGFSETMSELRRKKGASQRTAAADLGISQALLSHYENGAREPGLDFVCRACEYYGVSADYLLGLTASSSIVLDGYMQEEIELLYKLIRYFDDQKKQR